MVVSSRLSAPLRSALPEKSLELLTMTRRISSSSSVAVVPPPPPPRRRTRPVNHDRNLGALLLVLRRLGSDVVPSAPAVVSKREDSGDWRSGPPFPGIPDFRSVSLSVSILSESAPTTAGETDCEFSRAGDGDGGCDGDLSVGMTMLPLRRARSRASRRLTALSRRRWSR